MRLGEYPQAVRPSNEGSSAEASPSRPAEADTSEAAARGDEARALQSLGFSKPLIQTLTARARRNGTTTERELLHHPGIDENAYYGAMARLLRLPFVERLVGADLVDIGSLDTQLCRPVTVRIHHRRQAPQVAVVPEARRLADLAAALITRPMLRQDLVVTTPSAIRKAVWDAGAQRRVRQTIAALFEDRPQFSARTVLTGSQGFIAGLLVSPFLISLFLAPQLILPVLHPILSYLLSCGPDAQDTRARLPQAATAPKASSG